jgi:hypothetical protein
MFVSRVNKYIKPMLYFHLVCVTATIVACVLVFDTPHVLMVYMVSVIGLCSAMLYVEPTPNQLAMRLVAVGLFPCAMAAMGVLGDSTNKTIRRLSRWKHNLLDPHAAQATIWGMCGHAACVCTAGAVFIATPGSGLHAVRDVEFVQYRIVFAVLLQDILCLARHICMHNIPHLAALHLRHHTVRRPVVALAMYMHAVEFVWEWLLNPLIVVNMVAGGPVSCVAVLIVLLLVRFCVYNDVHAVNEVGIHHSCPSKPCNFGIFPFMCDRLARTHKPNFTV